ncbi:integrase [Paucihalobacter ruber]|uniref:Integrase n=1 Tax=Paucihalobacter ruber TaxID=2567861 RepID=A0A506PD08_9FLAO|nr:site-specific tyrosine recombinase/integron integrase [Paucihalobacter ruber]TPV31414.1 integrase [Paucihalobacter ruber]
MTQKIVITLKPLLHRERPQIGIYFGFNNHVKDQVKAYQGVKWSKTHRIFYVEDSNINRAELFKYLNQFGYWVDYSAIKNTMLPKAQPIQTNKLDKVGMYKELPQTHQDKLKRYIDYLRGKRLSDSTIKSYGYFILRFLHYHKDVMVNSWTNEHIDLFMENVLAKEHYSISSHRQSVGAIKYFTELCGMAAFDASGFERPKKSKFLPVVLSKEEVIDILQATKNLKHRAVLALIYSSGLRIGELLNMELKDIDIDRSQVHIKNGKGRKDRTVVLSEVIKPLLYNYIQTYKPQRYFVEGAPGEPYTAGSVRQFLRKACDEAGIKKRVTPHTLRHSYATHMLENGVDLRFIQELLGHSKPETTMIYTHVAQKDLMKVQSPLDVTVDQITKSNKGEQKLLLSRNFK